MEGEREGRKMEGKGKWKEGDRSGDVRLAGVTVGEVSCRVAMEEGSLVRSCPCCP